MTKAAQAMKKAWEIFKKEGIRTAQAWSAALRQAWVIVKGVVKEMMNIGEEAKKIEENATDAEWDAFIETALEELRTMTIAQANGQKIERWVTDEIIAKNADNTVRLGANKKFKNEDWEQWDATIFQETDKALRIRHTNVATKVVYENWVPKSAVKQEGNTLFLADWVAKKYCYNDFI